MSARIEASFPTNSEKIEAPDFSDDESDIAISAEIEKLIIRVRHMEYNVNQNVKRGESLATKCYSLIRSTELLAFDFIFAEYLLTNTPATKVFEFLEHCIHPKFNLSSGSAEDFTAAEKYAKELQDLIQTTAQKLLTTDIHEESVTHRTSDFVVFLRDQKTRLAQEINESKEAALDMSIPEGSDAPEDADMSSPDFPATLQKWIQSSLRFDESPEEPTIELRCLINAVSRRLSNVTNLHNEINEMRHRIIDEEKINFTDCDASALINSPFFAGLKSSCNYLRLSLQTLMQQQEILGRFQSSLEECQNYLAELSDRAQSAVQEMRNQLGTMNEHVAAKEGELETIKSGLKEFVDKLNEEPQLQRFSDNQDALKLYDDIETNLNVSNDSKGSGSEMSIDDEKDLLQKVRTERDELAKLCDEQDALIEEIHEKNKLLFSLIAANKKTEEESHLAYEESMLLKQFDSSINDTLDTLKLSEMTQWCQQLSDVGESFKKITQSQREVENEFRKFAETKERDEVDAEKQNRVIEQLCEENYETAQNLGKVKLELESAKEDLFRAQQEVEQISIVLPDCIDKRNIEQVKRYKNMVLCPLCKVNRRDTIITSCGHALCRHCVENSGSLCPVCKKPFREENICPFIMQ